jgi:3-methyladenine DNA glycosylase AlkC
MPAVDSQSGDSNDQAFKHLIGKELLRRMSKSLVQVHPEFDRKSFMALLRKLEPLEMKPRVRFLREELKKRLPAEYTEALSILLKSVQDGTLSGFDLWPYSDFVQTYGLKNLKISLDALKIWTPLFSSEFAVRPFLIQAPSETLRYLESCAEDDDEHLRRWATEGTRPRLPWGERLQRLIENPSLAMPILEKLKFDPALYVRKSVSNHLNDISKDHPDLVINTLARWKNQANPAQVVHLDWIIHRSLRTLIKAGHPGALRLIGVSRELKIKFTELKINKKSFFMGERLELSFKLKSTSHRAQKLVIDYIVYYVKANQRTSPKVFKLRTINLPAQGSAEIVKSHHLKRVTTRAHYPGIHSVAVQINGRVLGQISWNLRIN